MSEELLKINCLTTGYNGKPIVKCFNLNVQEKQKIVIMGPSGSGKTTLLKTIPLLVKPFSGEILFKGKNLLELKENELRLTRSKIGYLPQQYVLFPHLKVIDNIILPLKIVLKIQVEKALETAYTYMRVLGIMELAEKYPARLSGGQRQRVALARALSMNPELLLLDEPTSALDPESRIDVLDALYKVSGLGKALIIVTHEIDFALEIADKLLFMEKGVVSSMGEPYMVVKNNPRIRKFVEKMVSNYNSYNPSV